MDRLGRRVQVAVLRTKARKAAGVHTRWGFTSGVHGDGLVLGSNCRWRCWAWHGGWAGPWAMGLRQGLVVHRRAGPG